MAVPEEIQEKVLEEATSATPNYDVDYNDKRFTNIENDKQQALTQHEQMYGGMINNADKYYQDQKDAVAAWGDKQAQLQQDRTDFTIEQINQQKAQAEKDYKKEQSGAYVDWRKQSNEYGVEAEKMASAGLDNTGYSESAQVSMYNTYQNRVATARESFQNAVLNYNNAIKDAQLQNNAALAEIAYNTLQQQLELGLQGFQYKNQLIIDQANKKIELDNMYWNRYQDVLQQINTENAMKEEVRQFESNQAFQKEQAELDRQFTAEQNRLDQEFKAAQAELDRKHDIALLEAKTKAEKELADHNHKLAMAELAQKHANDKALLDKEYALKQQQNTANYSGGSSGSNSSGSTYGNKANASTKNSSGNTVYLYDENAKKAMQTFTGSSYKDACAFLKKYGKDSSSIMTESEWSRRRNSYSMTGQGSYDVTGYSSYKTYVQDKVNWIMSGK